MDVGAFFDEIVAIHAHGNATEHSYRPALTKLFNSISDEITATNEPQHLTDVGAPDFSFHRGDVAIGHGEAKKLGVDLKAYIKKEGKEQFDRYRKALPNLLYTDGLTFLFYKDGELRHEVNIGEDMFGWKAKPEQFDALKHALEDFAAQRPQTIRSPAILARLMAGKASLIKDILKNSLVNDADNNTDLVGQYKAFKEQLIHDITPGEFADIYAETIAYGLFAARLHDETLDTFSRQEALDLLPKSNPFLRNLFGYIAGPSLDERVKWVIDDLADVFQACDVAKIMEGFGKLTGRRDPFIHFYEDFIGQYNPKKKKARGVWYTPEAVVNFIVRAVDDVLKSEFGLPMGLADNSKITINWDTGQSKKGKPLTIKKEVHRVQVLDPATGTGTFLAEVIKQIEPRIKKIAAGQWNHYVEKELIPRLHGFELLMASYAMCHMKIDMILTELGYKPTGSPPRLEVYLTNSLEEGEREVRDLFMAQWLSHEAREANNIKRQQPIMCIIGNPPYNIMSGNLSDEQVALVAPYRSVDGVPIKEKGMLQFEKNINNDYIKFMALAEQVIRKNGFGVLGFITSHGYLKSTSFRGLRSHLLETFHTVRILDLHGNSEIREVPPDGVNDKNVFDIKQGVAIILAIRENRPVEGKGRVLFSELWGSRGDKYSRLSQALVSDLDWVDCNAAAPNYIFHPSGAAFDVYSENSPSLVEWFPTYSSGVITARDAFSISEDSTTLIENARQFAESPALSNSELCRILGIAEKKGWDITKARRRLASLKDYEGLIKPISYRPFDDRMIIFDESLVWTTARVTMDSMLAGQNFALVSARSEKSGTCSHFYVSEKLVETKCGERTTQSAVFPLYIYPDAQELDQERRTNLNPKLLKQMKEILGNDGRGCPEDLDVFDFIYGVLHIPQYRDMYAEFLKIDFPRIPWPKSADEFWHVSGKGRKLRRLHLMEPSVVGETPFPFEGDGSSIVERATYADGRVWINESQSFADVPPVAWEFYIGGYQPAQKWLKDRKGRELSFDDILHYQKIIKILFETDRIMKTITMDLT